MPKSDDAQIKSEGEGGKVGEKGKAVALSGREQWRVLLRVLRSSTPELGSLGLGTAALFVNSITNLYVPYAIGECPGREGVEKSGKI
jgi:hypothetical protein